MNKSFLCSVGTRLFWVLRWVVKQSRGKAWTRAVVTRTTCPVTLNAGMKEEKVWSLRSKNTPTSDAAFSLHPCKLQRARQADGACCLRGAELHEIKLLQDCLGDRTRDQAAADRSRIQQPQPHTAQVLAAVNTCWFSSASLGNTSCRDQLVCSRQSDCWEPGQVLAEHHDWGRSQGSPCMAHVLISCQVAPAGKLHFACTPGSLQKRQSPCLHLPRWR